MKPSLPFRFAIACLSILPLACAPGEDAGAAGGRIVAIGDLHGDLEAARRALRLADAIDAQDRWIGKDLTVVQTGDEIDRGDDDRLILDLFEKLKAEAAKAGGSVHALNGNHEIMNALGDFRYVTSGGFMAFYSIKGLNLGLPGLGKLPQPMRPRAAAFAPGGPYAKILAQRPVILVLAGNVFVHGGVLPPHAKLGVDQINQGYQDWLAGSTAQLPEMLSDPQSPIWTRIYSDPKEAPACEMLDETLSKLGARRMVVGHSVQSEINSACQGRVWRIDVGMARVYGGPIQVLEIRGDQLRVLSETKPG
ncbi:MAG TPA: shewanella-like protein phosphatase [Candidatus Obscuribacterales bacterium]